MNDFQKTLAAEGLPWTPNKLANPKQARAPLTIYMGARALRLEAVPRRQNEPKGLLGSSLAGQLLSTAAQAWTAYSL